MESKRNKSQPRRVKRRRSTKRVKSGESRPITRSHEQKVTRTARRSWTPELIEPIKQSLLDVFINAGLFERVIEYCCTSVLGTLMRVCKATFRAASKLLYRHLSYSDTQDPLSKDRGPGSTLDGPYSKAACLRHTESLVLWPHSFQGCPLHRPPNLDILYLYPDTFLFGPKLKVCETIQSFSPRVLIIRSLSVLVNLRSFRQFYGSGGLEKVVLLAWDNGSLPTYQIDRFLPATDVVIVCRGAPACMPQQTTSLDNTARILSPEHGSGVDPNLCEQAPQARLPEARGLSVGSPSEEVEPDDEDPTPILPPYMRALTRTICRNPHDAYNYKRWYTIVDAHLWDPRCRANPDDNNLMLIRRALDAVFDRFVRSDGRASAAQYELLSGSEFRDLEPDVAGCLDQADELFE